MTYENSQCFEGVVLSLSFRFAPQFEIHTARANIFLFYKIALPLRGKN